jgi:hypothetical protein
MRTDRTPQAVVTALVHAGLLDASRSSDAERVVSTVLTPVGAPAPPLRRRMAEIAGYVGAAFVVGAAGLFFASEWGSLSQGEQGGILVAIAAVLAAAAVTLVVTGGGVRRLTEPTQEVRRRLGSVLFTGAAGAAGFAAAVLVDDRSAYTDDSLAVLLGAVVALAVALVGYRVAPSVVGELGTAVAAVTAIPSGLDVLGSAEGLTTGGLVLLLGVVWLLLAERGVWREDESARVLGVTLAVIGAQIPVSDDHGWVAYVATAAVGVATFGMYVVRPAWPYLAAGVVAMTLAVPEALSDWTDGSLGSAGVLLVTGVTLLVAALAGLRLRQEVSEPGRHA